MKKNKAEIKDGIIYVQNNQETYAIHMKDVRMINFSKSCGDIVFYTKGDTMNVYADIDPVKDDGLLCEIMDLFKKTR